MENKNYLNFDESNLYIRIGKIALLFSQLKMIICN